jgi:flagella basal body P-ring formation protein FlgA
MWQALTSYTVLAAGLAICFARIPNLPVSPAEEYEVMSTEMTPIQDNAPQSRGRLLFGLIPGGRSAPSIHHDTTELPVSPRVARDVQWEVARRWGIDPDRVHLEFGRISGSAPDRVASVRLLGTGTKGHWVALLSPADPSITPTRVRLRAGVERAEPVATRDLERGEPLTVGDIGHDVAVSWGAPRGREETVEPGWIVHRRVKVGEALKAPAVAPPDAVTSGEAVEVLWRRGAVSVSLAGVALGSGPVGTEVRVRTESGRELRGVAQSDGVVLVGNPVRKER